MRKGRVAKEARQREAQERNKERAERGDVAQFIKLMREGHGHCKEASRLLRKLCPCGTYCVCDKEKQNVE